MTRLSRATHRWSLQTKAFFVELGLKLQGEGPVEGGWVDRVVGLEGVRAEIAMVETPDGTDGSS